MTTGELMTIDDLITLFGYTRRVLVVNKDGLLLEGNLEWEVSYDNHSSC